MTATMEIVLLTTMVKHNVNVKQVGTAKTVPFQTQPGPFDLSTYLLLSKLPLHLFPFLLHSKMPSCRILIIFIIVTLYLSSYIIDILLNLGLITPWDDGVCLRINDFSGYIYQIYFTTYSLLLISMFVHVQNHFDNFDNHELLHEFHFPNS